MSDLAWCILLTSFAVLAILAAVRGLVESNKWMPPGDPTGPARKDEDDELL